jgi:uncharacterized protein (DUF697 family)
MYYFMDLAKMSKKADEVIAGWSFGSLAGNLLPPPFDMMAVGSAFAAMGYQLSKVYEVPTTLGEMKRIGKVIAKGIASVSGAAYVGTSIFKYVPGVNIWVALLMQPVMVGAMAYSAGKTYKDYFEFHITKGENLSDSEIRTIAEKALRARVGK